MSSLRKNTKIKRLSEAAATSARQFLLTAGAEPDDEAEAKRLVQALMEVYQSWTYDYDQKIDAVEVASQLCSYPEVLEYVTEDARLYAETQHVGDASPYTPNSFDVLRRVGGSNVAKRLVRIVKSEHGIGRWAALEALCRMHAQDPDPAVDRFLSELVRGKHPPRTQDFGDDNRIVESCMTKQWVEQRIHSYGNTPLAAVVGLCVTCIMLLGSQSPALALMILALLVIVGIWAMTSIRSK